MTARALLISATLLLAICGFGYYSHHVAGLPSMINGALPLAVFATLVLLVLVANPLLSRLAPGLPFGGRELAVIVALGACVCGYTGATYLRYLASAAVLPAHAARTKPAWQATEVLAYVPGYVGRVAEGQVRDPRALARRVVAESEADGASAISRLWQVADAADQRMWRQISRSKAPAADQRAQVAALINRALAHPAFLDEPAAGEVDRLAAGRLWLQAAMPDLLRAPPRGGGVLLHAGRYEPDLHDGILFGRLDATVPSPRAVDWVRWWPVIHLWGGLMALLMLTVICLSVIVRRQWADHERLAFPLVRFAVLMLERQPGRGLPTVAHASLFWVGFAIFALHLVNGLNAWFPSLPHLPLQLDLGPLRQLFPNAARTWQASGLFEPNIRPTVIALAFFLPRAISLSFGLTTFIYVLIASQLIAHGIGLGDGMARPPFHELLNFGAMLGLVAVMLYTGRRYYSRVALHALLPNHLGSTPPSVRWAFRGLIVLVPWSIYHLTGSGLSPLFATLAVGLVLLLWLVTARIVCETGLFRIGSSILPVSLAAACFGLDGVGPTHLIVLTLVGILLATDLWETPMAYTVTGLQLARRTGVPTRTLAPGLAVTALVGLVVALAATLSVQHHFGLIGRVEGIRLDRSLMALDVAARAASDLAATGQLQEAIDASDSQRLLSLRWDVWSLGWIGAGLALFVFGAAARLRLPWWPIHPVLFVLLGNWGLVTFGFSFLLGWILKASVVGIGGARAYHRLLPLMAGVIAGGLVSGVFWLLVGLTYFIATGSMPASYSAY